MRLSADPRDPGYHKLAHMTGITITLDGEPLRDVVTADEDLGIVLVQVRDRDGHFVLDGSRARIATRIRKGKVVVTIPYELVVHIVP
jgi:hypothetical protein